MARSRWILPIALVLTVGAISAQEAAAQHPRRSDPYSRPVLSPYLNLLRRDSSVTENYFMLVRPQIRYNETLNQQQREITALNRNIQNLESIVPGEQQPLRGTGHPSAFLNFSHFYPNAR